MIRPLQPEEAPAAARAWVRARHAAYPAVPRAVHPDDEAVAWFVEQLVPDSDVHVALDGGEVVGVLVLGEGSVDHLYVVPEHTGRGVGTQLLERAQHLQPGGLSLWTFQSNERARAFYARHGFVEVEATDGAGNEERAPDVRMVWPGSRSPQPYDVVAGNLDPEADNRIHDDEVARSFGFRGALVPGVEVFALASAPLVAAWGEAFLAGGRMSLRFRKPVYDGERVQVALGDQLTVTGPDGLLRASGAAVAVAAPEPVADHEVLPLPESPAAEPGVLGTVEVPGDAQACAEYARRIGDPSPLYAHLVHPGLLLRLVNLALMSSVELGPWIHTASDCRFLGLAHVDEALQVRSRVTERFTRNGHDYVRYDALLRAGERPVALVHHEAIWRLAAQRV